MTHVRCTLLIPCMYVIDGGIPQTEIKCQLIHGCFLSSLDRDKHTRD